MAETSLRKTFTYKLIPTLKQEGELECVVLLCRQLYNTALEQRITAWQRCHVSVSRFEQEAELKELRAAFPEYAALHSHVLQDVLARLDKTYQAFFRRVQRGEKAGFPRFKGRDRFHSLTFKEYGNGARLDNGCLVLAKIGRLAVRWSRPLEGTLNSPTAGLGAVNAGPPGADSTLGSDLIAQHYPAPAGILAQVYFGYGQPVWQSPAQVGIAQQQLGAMPAVKFVLGPLTPNGIPLTVSQLAQLHQILGAPQTLPTEEPARLQGKVPLPLYNAYRGTAQYISADGRTILFVTILKDSSGGTATVPALRSAVTHVGQAAGADQSGIFGTDELAYDVGQVTTSDLDHIIPLVAVLIALLLALVLRSLIAPLYLVASVVLSYLAALGLASIVFVHLRGQDGIQFVLPFLMFVFLMALGSDYNILVMTRIREEAHTKPLREAVRHAVSITGTTVTTAGLVLAGTFAVLGFAAGGSQNAAQIQQIGFGIAAGVLMDTFLVRTLLVPALAVLLGRWNWWPSPLFKQAAALERGRTAASSGRTIAIEAEPSAASRVEAD